VRTPKNKALRRLPMNEPPKVLMLLMGIPMMKTRGEWSGSGEEMEA